MNDDRRRLLGAVAGAATGVVGAVAFSGSTGATAGVAFDADNVTVETDDGNLRALTVAPAGTVSWAGLEEPAGHVELSLYGKRVTDLQYHELGSQRLDAAGLHGEREYAFETANLFDYPGFTAADFEAEDGKRNVTPVKLRLTVDVFASDGETELTSGRADTQFVVKVVNVAETANATGDGNTGAKTETTTTTETETEATTTETTNTTETETETTTTETIEE